MYAVQSPYTVKILEIEKVKEGKKKYYCIVMESMKGSLKDLIKQLGGCSEEKAIKIMGKIVKSYKFLYGKKIIHRDMKPDNVLYNLLKNGDYDFKICDFGVSKDHIAAESNTVIGTSLYMAPEVKTKVYDNKVDLYAIGIMMFELLIGQHPIE